jgi:iron complex outermembrane receptor protein
MSDPRFRLSTIVLLTSAALAGLGVAPAVLAQDSAPVVSISLKAQALGSALNELAGQARLQLMVNPELIAGKQAPAVSGNLTPAQALERLLAGSGLKADIRGSDVVVRKVGEVAGELTLPAVRVTSATDKPDTLPAVYAGGQVARGGKIGILGNKDFLDTPFNTMNYTSELMDNQNAKTVADVLMNDPSVRFTTPAGHMVENYYIRGFLVTADNMAMNGMYGVAPYGHVPTEFLERVEVFKGPSALVNGMSPNGAIGGTINLVPKRAGDTPITRVGFDYESGSQFGTRLDVGRRFGEGKELGVRFNGAYRDGETEVDSQSKTRSLGALALDYRGEKLRLNLDLYDSVEKTANGSPMMISFLSGVVAPPKSSTNLFKGTRSSMNNTGAALRGEVDINDSLSAYAAIGTRKNTYEGFINGTRANNVTASGAFTGQTQYQNAYTNSFTYEGGLRGKLTTGPVKHEIVVSASTLELESGTISKASANFASNIYNPTTALVATYPGFAPKTQETTLSGIAVADTLGFFEDKLAVTLGMRSQNVKDTSFNATTGLVTAAYDKSVVTPAVGVVVKPWAEPVSLYANYIEGLSKGGTAPSTSVNANQVFAPYVTEQREVGAKWDAGKYAHTVSLYEISEPSMITNAANVTSIDGEKRVRGLEWTVFGELTRDIRLLGGVTFAKGTQLKTSNGINDGKEAYGIPSWQGNMGLEWDTPWVPGLTLNGRVVHTDAQYLNSANTLEIPSWTRYDAGLRYATKVGGQATVIRGTIANLFNKDYWAGPYHGEGYTTLSAPRTISLSATIDF